MLIKTNATGFRAEMIFSMPHFARTLVYDLSALMARNINAVWFSWFCKNNGTSTRAKMVLDVLILVSVNILSAIFTFGINPCCFVVVVSNMVNSLQNNKIFNSIIRCYSIYVVDMFVWLNRTTQMLFHYISGINLFLAINRYFISVMEFYKEWLSDSNPIGFILSSVKREIALSGAENFLGFMTVCAEGLITEITNKVFHNKIISQPTNG